MKKRVLSGLLAVMMLLSTAFAAGEGAVAAEEDPSAGTVLTFTAADQMTDDAAEQVRTVLEHRLDQLNLAGASVSFPDDRQTVLVTLPAGTDTDGVAEFLAWENELAFTDADGKVWLTGADVSESSLGFADDQTPYIQVSFTEEGEETFTEALDTASELTVTMDGEEIAQVTADNAGENGGCTLTGSFTEDEARLFVARIAAHTLPVTLTPVSSTEEQPAEPEQPATPAFPDIAGHWAEDALNRAVSLGLLNGVDGKMLPDNAVKRSEAIVILNRALGADVADNTSGLTGTPQNAWYVNDLGKAIHLGLIDANDSRNFDTASTRAEAFELLARAFAYDRAEAAEDELSVFTDTNNMTDAQRHAAAALVAAGIVNGETATTLNPQGQLTRAQFVTMLLRIIGTFPADTAETAQPGGTLVTAAEAALTDTQSNSDYIFACDTTAIKIDGATLGGRVVLKGGEAAELTAENNSSIAVLAADPAGTADITLDDDSSVVTLVIAGTGGAVSFDGAATNIEITASGRTIDLSGMEADTLTVTGSGNTIVVDDSIQAVAVNGGAKNNTLTLNTSVDTLLVAGVGTRVDGSGKADTVDIRAINCEVSIDSNSTTENIDKGLDGVSIQIGVPEKVLPGGSLLTQVSFTGVTEDKICSAQWYQDGEPIANYGNDHFELTAGKVSNHTTYFTFTKDMKTSVTMGFKLTYDNPSTGETEEVYAEKTVPIENYSDEWYYERDVNRVLNLVSSTYAGNYTTAYAVNGDYSQTEKEIWINAKGYSSNTQYLLWINRAYQHVNVFQGSKGNWKMIKSFLVGTGAAGTPTPTGLTTVSYKSAGGWTTGTYTVRPVVGFYPGTGYAFHSRLCYPGTDTEYDFSAGYPVSHGCVRMYKSDIQWIYNNIPVGTAVVIF